MTEAEPLTVFSWRTEPRAQAVAQNPVVVYFQVWDDFWYLGGGVYDGKCPTSDITVNHAVRACASLAPSLRETLERRHDATQRGSLDRTRRCCWLATM